MATKTKLKIFPTILVLAGVFAAYHFVFRVPATTENGRGEEKVTVTVDFTPEERSYGPTEVYIEFLINGSLIYDDTAVRSPWQKDVQVGKGQTLRVLATQQYGNSLECLVSDAVVSDGDYVQGPGQVSCEYRSKLGGRP